MTLKGEWSAETTYSVGDVVRYSNGNFYNMVRPGKAGVPCPDALYWNILPSPLQECAKMILDVAGDLTTAIGALAETIPTNIDDESIVLKSGDNEYLVSVDASGDDPEVVATLIEEEAEEGT